MSFFQQSSNFRFLINVVIVHLFQKSDVSDLYDVVSSLTSLDGRQLMAQPANVAVSDYRVGSFHQFYCFTTFSYSPWNLKKNSKRNKMCIWMYSIGANQTTPIRYSLNIHLFEKCAAKMELPKTKKIVWIFQNHFKVTLTNKVLNLKPWLTHHYYWYHEQIIQDIFLCLVMKTVRARNE